MATMVNASCAGNCSTVSAADIAAMLTECSGAIGSAMADGECAYTKQIGSLVQRCGSFLLSSPRLCARGWPGDG